LRQNGIAVVLDRPGVGANLQDHLQLRLIFKVDGITTLNERYHSPFGFARMLAEYALLRTGPLTMAPSQLGLFTRSDRDQARANLQYQCAAAVARPLASRCTNSPPLPRASPILRPTSRGTVRLRSRDPSDPPLIKPNYLSTDEDRRVAVSSIRLTRRIAAQPALAPFHPDEYLPGAQVRDDDEPRSSRPPAISAPPSFTRSAPQKMGLASDPMMVSTAACVSPASSGCGSSMPR